MLYGRGRECARIADLVTAARAGRGGALVLRGEAGIGKSALLDDAADHASNMLVLYSSGFETESELPFAGLHRLLRPIKGLTDRLPDPQRDALGAAFGDGAQAPTEKWLTSLAVLNLLAEAATSTPVLCLVDDAQWLDTASADALTFVARRIQAEGIAMLFAARDGALRPFEAAGLPHLDVAGLDESAAHQLLTAVADGPVAHSVRARLVADTLGNPLALAELAGSLPPGLLDGSAPLPERLPLGADVEALFGDRARQLPEDTRTLLLVAAANDSDDLDTVLRAAALLGVAPVALDAAEAARMVSVTGAVIAFRHPLVRSAIYRGATSQACRNAERVLAEVLDGERDTDRRTWHLANASTGPDDDVSDQLSSVAERAADRGAHAAAAAAFTRAAELAKDSAVRGDRFTSAAEAAWLAGQPERARELLDRAAPATSHTLLRGRAAHLRGSIDTACGSPTVAYATLVEGAELLADADPARAGLMIAEAGQIAWGTGDLMRIVQAGDRLSALPDTGNPGAQAIVGLARFMQGDPAAAAKHLTAAANLAHDSGPPQMVMLAAAGAMFLGDDVRAIDLFTRAVARTRSAGAAATLPVLLAPLSTIEMFTGRYVTATTDADEGLRLATETGQENPAAHTRSVLAWLAAVQGRATDCTDLANAALTHAIGHRLGPHAAIATWALAHSDLVGGRPEEALDRLLALAGAAPGEGNQMVTLFATADLVEAATRVGQHVDATNAAARLEVWAGHTNAAWTHALVSRCRALLAVDDDESDGHFVTALDHHTRGGRPFDTARTALLFGARLRRRRRRADARKHLRVAVETFERLGATPWAEQARGELSATGETARKRDVTTLIALTPQELQIARLVAGGATNRTVAGQLFLSPRTVDYHLRKVFSKLHLSSRHELVRLALDDDALTAR